jgi:hypothetical protein
VGARVGVKPWHNRWSLLRRQRGRSQGLGRRSDDRRYHGTLRVCVPREPRRGQPYGDPAR